MIKICIIVFWYPDSNNTITIRLRVCLGGETGIPDSSEEDACVAKEVGVSWGSVVKTEEDGNHTLINSAEVHTAQVQNVPNKAITDLFLHFRLPSLPSLK